MWGKYFIQIILFFEIFVRFCLCFWDSIKISWFPATFWWVQLGTDWCIDTSIELVNIEFNDSFFKTIWDALVKYRLCFMFDFLVKKRFLKKLYSSFVLLLFLPKLPDEMFLSFSKWHVRCSDWFIEFARSKFHILMKLLWHFTNHPAPNLNRSLIFYFIKTVVEKWRNWGNTTTMLHFVKR